MNRNCLFLNNKMHAFTIEMYYTQWGSVYHQCTTMYPTYSLISELFWPYLFIQVWRDTLCMPSTLYQPPKCSSVSRCDCFETLKLYDNAIMVNMCVQVWRPCCTWKAWSWRTGTVNLLQQRDIRRENQFPGWKIWSERYHYSLYNYSVEEVNQKPFYCHPILLLVETLAQPCSLV